MKKFLLSIIFILIPVLSLAVTDAEINANILLYYNFDQQPEGTVTAPYLSDIVDNSGNSRYGYAGGIYHSTDRVPRCTWDTFTIDPIYAVDTEGAKISQALKFTGDEYVEILDTCGPTSNTTEYEMGYYDYTVVMFARASSSGNCEFYRDYKNDVGITIGIQGAQAYAAFYWKKGQSAITVNTSATSFANGTWHLVAARFDRDGNMRIDLIDEGGTVPSSPSANAVADISSYHVRIENSYPSFIGKNLNGWIDEFAIYDAYLTNAQLQFIADKTQHNYNPWNNPMNNLLYNPELGESGIDCVWCDDEDLIFDVYNVKTADTYTIFQTYTYDTYEGILGGSPFYYFTPDSDNPVTFNNKVCVVCRGTGNFDFYHPMTNHDSLGQVNSSTHAVGLGDNDGNSFVELGFGFAGQPGVVGHRPVHFQMAKSRLLVKYLQQRDSNLTHFFASGGSHGMTTASYNLLYNNDLFSGALGGSSIALDLVNDQKFMWDYSLHNLFFSFDLSYNWAYSLRDIVEVAELYNIMEGSYPVVDVLNGNGTQIDWDLIYKVCLKTNSQKIQDPLVMEYGNQDVRSGGETLCGQTYKCFPSDLIRTPFNTFGSHGGDSVSFPGAKYGGPSTSVSWVDWIVDYDRKNLPPDVATGGISTGAGYDHEHIKNSTNRFTALTSMDAHAASFDESEPGSITCTELYKHGYGVGGRLESAYFGNRDLGDGSAEDFITYGSDGGMIHVLEWDDTADCFFRREYQIDGANVNWGAWAFNFSSDESQLLVGDITGKLHYFDTSDDDTSLWNYVAFTGYKDPEGNDYGIQNDFGNHLSNMRVTDIDSDGTDEFWFINFHGNIYAVSVTGTTNLNTHLSQWLEPKVLWFEIADIDGDTTQELVVASAKGIIKTYAISMDANNWISLTAESESPFLKATPINLQISDNAIHVLTRPTEFYDLSQPIDDTADIYAEAGTSTTHKHQLYYALDKSDLSIIDQMRVYGPTFPGSSYSICRSFDIHTVSTTDHIVSAEPMPRIYRFDITNGYEPQWYSRDMGDIYIDSSGVIGEVAWGTQAMDIPHPYYDPSNANASYYSTDLIGPEGASTDVRRDFDWQFDHFVLHVKVYDLENDGNEEIIVLTNSGWVHVFEGYTWLTSGRYGDGDDNGYDDLPQLIEIDTTQFGSTVFYDAHRGSGADADILNTARGYLISTMADYSPSNTLGTVQQYGRKICQHHLALASESWYRIKGADDGGALFFEENYENVMTQKASFDDLFEAGHIYTAQNFNTGSGLEQFTQMEIIPHYSGGLKIYTGGTDQDYVHGGHLYLSGVSAGSHAIDTGLAQAEVYWFSGMLFADGTPTYLVMDSGEIDIYHGTYEMDYPEEDTKYTAEYTDNYLSTPATYNNDEFVAGTVGGIIGVFKMHHPYAHDNWDQFDASWDDVRIDDETWDYESTATEYADSVPDIAGTGVNAADVDVKDGYLWYTDVGSYVHGIQIADPDNDSQNEIVVAVMHGSKKLSGGEVVDDITYGGKIYVYEYDDNESLPTASTFSLGAYYDIPGGAVSVEVYNINQFDDSDIEIVAGSADGRIYILQYTEGTDLLELEYRSEKYGMIAGKHDGIYFAQLTGNTNREIIFGTSEGVVALTVD